MIWAIWGKVLIADLRVIYSVIKVLAIVKADDTDLVLLLLGKSRYLHDSQKYKGQKEFVH
jgi:hypothetical protein